MLLAIFMIHAPCNHQMLKNMIEIVTTTEGDAQRCFQERHTPQPANKHTARAEIVRERNALKHRGNCVRRGTERQTQRQREPQLDKVGHRKSQREANVTQARHTATQRVQRTDSFFVEHPYLCIILAVSAWLSGSLLFKLSLCMSAALFLCLTLRLSVFHCRCPHCSRCLSLCRVVSLLYLFVLLCLALCAPHSRL